MVLNPRESARALTLEVSARYLNKAAEHCVKQDEEWHACPNAGCRWGRAFPFPPHLFNEQYH